MFRQVVIVGIMFVCSIGLKADYSPLRLYDMIISADKIVYGEIVSIGHEKFTLKVEKSFLGDEDEIVINKFKNWTCAHRWVEYELGQKALFFLRENEDGLFIKSAGNEGEMPVFDDRVYVNMGILHYYPDTVYISEEKHQFRNTLNHEVYGGRYYGYKFHIDEFFQVVHHIRTCITFQEKEKNYAVQCQQQKLNRLIDQFAVFKWVYETLKLKQN